MHFLANLTPHLTTTPTSQPSFILRSNFNQLLYYSHHVYTWPFGQSRPFGNFGLKFKPSFYIYHTHYVQVQSFFDAQKTLGERTPQKPKEPISDTYVVKSIYLKRNSRPLTHTHTRATIHITGELPHILARLQRNLQKTRTFRV